MKKIININLSGRVIPIEDAAYEKLQGYVESLRRYFAHEEGRDEIINDIESRIAELMSDRVKKGADCITDADVDAIINSMGRVEDFEAADKEASATASQESAESTASAAGPGPESTRQSKAADDTFTAERKPRGRLYRDTNDRFIGGVCSGISNYTNIDPAIVRLIFAILVFSWGLGFLAYIILWIVLPPKDLEPYVGKKLYRNPDDRIIGGVAGGLAAYFNTRVSTLRLIFAAPLLINILFSVLRGISGDYHFNFFNIGVGSFTGTFILAYIILWIVLPEAETEYEKMEMRGETVDINRIRENVKAGMESMKTRMQGWGEEVKASAQQFSKRAGDVARDRSREFATEVKESSRRSGRGIGHAFAVIFKVFFLFIAGVVAFGLFAAVMALIFGGVAWWPVNNYLWTSDWQQVLAWCTLILFLLVPLVGFIIWLVRRIMRVRSRSNYLGWTFGGLWALGWVAVTLFVSTIVRDFRSYQADETMLTIQQPPQGKMVVAVSQPELEFQGDYEWISGDSRGWDLGPDTLRIAAVDLKVKPSADANYRVMLRKYSFGRTRSEALNRAAQVDYTVVSRDSVLDLGNAYAITRSAKFRGQNVEIVIEVPVGKKIRFDESVDRKLSLIHVKVKRSLRRDRAIGIEISDDEEAFRYKAGVDYIMDPGGILRDPQGKPLDEPAPADYRYPGTEPAAPAATPATDTTANEAIRRQLDEEKKRREESERKIRELEEQMKKGSGTRIRERFQQEPPVAVTPSPLGGLVQCL